MHVLPLPPYPSAPPPAGLSPTRLWFLCLVAGFTRAQIGVLTGLPEKEVYYKQFDSHVWRQRHLTFRDKRKDNTVLRLVARQLGVALPKGSGRRNVPTRLRRALREAVVSGRIGWEEIDRLRFDPEFVRYEFE